MTTYRVISRTPLSTGHKKGDLVEGNRFKPDILQALVAADVLAVARTPPLSELPGWELRAPRLASLGIVRADQFIEADKETLEIIRKEFHYKTLKPIKNWQREVTEWLKPTVKIKRN